MIRKNLTFILALAAFGAACQNQKPVAATTETSSPSTNYKLITRLSAGPSVAMEDSVALTFTVINKADTAQSFCKWETPFEPRLGKYMEITDAQGNEAQFTGAMAKRMMPPPASSYIKVPPHDSVSTTVNLANNYIIKSGSYTIKYIGGGVSGLEPGNELKIKVATK